MSQVRQYASIPDFFRDNLSFLEQNEAANNLTIGIPKMLLENADDQIKVNLFSIFTKEEPDFCLVQTVPRNFLISGKKEFAGEGLDLLIKKLIENKVPSTGIIGPKELAKNFAELWKQQSGQSYKTTFRQWVYQLDRVNNIKLSSGFMRSVQRFDFSLIERWAIDFSEMFMNGMTSEQAWKFAESKIRDQTLFLWEDQGQAVSMAAVSRPSRNGITINYVYTPVEFRGRGYASSCVSQLSRLMLEKYKFCALFTDADNPTSNKIYKNIGYYPLEEFRELTFL